MPICADCRNEFTTSGKTKRRVEIAFCKSCRKVRGADILELITSSQNLCFADVKLAESHMRDLPPTTLRLDLHKTLDTIGEDVKLPEVACCVSYVGSLTVTRIEARQEIKRRIKTGQIEYGALVFRRANRKATEDERNSFDEDGSKAWFNTVIPCDPTVTPLFVDDSDDHVLSVESVGIPSVQIYGDQDLIAVIERWYEPVSNGSSDDLFGSDTE